MGQKVNPIGLRLGINRTWDSRWYSGRREYGQLLHEDMKIRDYLREQLKTITPQNYTGVDLLKR